MPERLISQKKLTEFTAACLEKLGLAVADARLVAETLVASNLRGVDSHGVVRLPHYAKRLRNGTVRLTHPLDALKVPPTVQDIIASRIDRLPAAEKELLQTLAVIGMEFTLALAGEVTKKPDDELNRLLNDLQLAELIYEQPAADDMGYIFKHALTHDVAYKSLLTERRRLLHERAGQAMEALYHERLDDHYDDLAHHFRRSDNAAKAVVYLRLRRRAVGAAFSSQPGNCLSARRA